VTSKTSRSSSGRGHVSLIRQRCGSVETLQVLPIAGAIDFQCPSVTTSMPSSTTLMAALLGRQLPQAPLTQSRCSGSSRLPVLAVSRWTDRPRRTAGVRLTPMPHSPYSVGRLEADTWDDFAELVERNNGIYGGCWCIPNHVEYQRGISDPRTLKEQLVRGGQAHATLVFDAEGKAQGWCQYGEAASLDLKHGREYRKDPPPPARWRIACIFVDKRHRGMGIARIALEGALSQIAEAGGGRVEAISETTRGREAQDRFLFSGTVELFEDLGFQRFRQVGKHAWIMCRSVRSRASQARRP